MSITGSIVVFILLWWLVLFIILPRNISSQQEKGNVVEGTDPGAPASPKIKKKTNFDNSNFITIICGYIYFNLF